MMKFRGKFDEILRKIWCNFGENLMKFRGKFDVISGKIWCNFGENLMKFWGKFDEILGKIWWNFGENLMKIWWNYMEKLKKSWANFQALFEEIFPQGAAYDDASMPNWLLEMFLENLANSRKKYEASLIKRF